jgi:iron complex transport system permease protein
MIQIKGKNYYRFIFSIYIGLLAALIIVSVAFGAANISILDAYRIIVSKIPIIKELVNAKNINESSMQIVINIRLPRILVAAIVGCGLSVVGAVYQSIFKNSMSDPYILGVSSGAALGASIAIVLGFDFTIIKISGTAFMAFIFAISTTFIVYNIARVGNKVSSLYMLLAGVAISFLLSSLISIIMIFNKNQMDQIIFWTMGSFSTSSWKQVEFLSFAILPLIFIIMFFARDINVIFVDEESARTLGIDSDMIKKLMLLLSSIIVSAIVSVSGIIGFIGLIIPHAVRMVYGGDNRIVIPISAVIGAGFMIICDALARTLLAPVEIPVGAITAVFGAPYFIYLLYINKRAIF